MTPRHLLLLLPVAALAGAVLAADPKPVPPAVAAAEKERVATINLVRPAVVAVLDYGGQGGGSGVVIDPEGYALTNYHVTEGMGPVMRAGLADGVAYDRASRSRSRSSATATASAPATGAWRWATRSCSPPTSPRPSRSGWSAG
jgi:S1-C subfamily serine protease